MEPDNTPLEQAILGLKAQGYSNEQIGEMLKQQEEKIRQWKEDRRRKQEEEEQKKAKKKKKSSEWSWGDSFWDLI